MRAYEVRALHGQQLCMLPSVYKFSCMSCGTRLSLASDEMLEAVV